MPWWRSTESVLETTTATSEDPPGSRRVLRCLADRLAALALGQRATDGTRRWAGVGDLPV